MPRNEGARALPVAALALVAILALAGVWARWLRPPASPRRPSVILIVIDTLRDDFLGSYGFPGPISPHLDRFATEAVRFENAYAPAPWTKPSVASLFTSLDPWSHGVLSHDGHYGADDATDALPAEAETLAEAMRAAGHATAGFVSNPWLLERYGFGQGFDHYADEVVGQTVSADALLEQARRWLAGRDPAQPFFLYLHLMDVHGPYDPPREDVRAVLRAPGLGPGRAIAAEEYDSIKPYLRGPDWTQGRRGRRTETWRAHYAAGVRALDRALGRFLGELRDDGLLDEAVVMVTSDHGEALGDHGTWDHGDSLHEHQIRVPLLLRLPGGRRGGTEVAPAVSLLDLMPTLLGLAGAPVPPAAQGRDLGDLARGRAKGGDEPVYATGVKSRPGLAAILWRRHKLVEDGDQRALYDLATDPDEHTDLSERAPAMTSELAARLARHRQERARGPRLRPAEAPLDRGVRDKLEALGYLAEEE